MFPAVALRGHELHCNHKPDLCKRSSVPNVGNLDLAYNYPVITGGGSNATVSVSNGRGVISQTNASDPSTGFEEFTVTVTCRQAGTDSDRTIAIVRSDKPEQATVTVSVTCEGIPDPTADKTSLTLEAAVGQSSLDDANSRVTVTNAGFGPYDYTVTFTSNDPSIATLEKYAVGGGVIAAQSSQVFSAKANCLKAGSTGGTMTISGLSSAIDIMIDVSISCIEVAIFGVENDSSLIHADYGEYSRNNSAGALVIKNIGPDGSVLDVEVSGRVIEFPGGSIQIAPLTQSISSNRAKLQVDYRFSCKKRNDSPQSVTFPVNYTTGKKDSVGELIRYSFTATVLAKCDGAMFKMSTTSLTILNRYVDGGTPGINILSPEYSGRLSITNVGDGVLTIYTTRYISQRFNMDIQEADGHIPWYPHFIAPGQTFTAAYYDRSYCDYDSQTVKIQFETNVGNFPLEISVICPPPEQR
jgi:hypothetical protein